MRTRNTSPLSAAAELAALLADTQSWMRHAACRDLAPAEADRLFFPEGRPLRAAQRMCAGCPVRRECARFGQGEEHGVWGGTTPRERGLPA